jgi:hypothetical protein
MIILESDFSLVLDGKSSNFSPKRPSEVGVLFSLLYRTIKSAMAFKDGRLEIEFTSRDKLLTNANANYEAWGIVGDRGLRIHCMPGGELAVWKPMEKTVNE